MTGGTLLSLGVSSDVMAVNGSWLLDELYSSESTTKVESL